ncbi:MAG: hypothetical protein DRG50_02145 [Deltaproteobacteria bacterium]|nr:MAG: hypothetical protein DRG50_02145 [Deltaproteobacteria bacterium]
MSALALIISIIALIIAIMAYQKVGGVADLKKQTEILSNIGEAIVKATNTLREKTADVLDKMEAALRAAKETKAGKKKEGKEEG